jgi:hypothetical protein
MFLSGLGGTEHVQFCGEHVPDAVHATDQPTQSHAGEGRFLPHEHSVPATALFHEARWLLQFVPQRLVSTTKHSLLINVYLKYYCVAICDVINIKSFPHQRCSYFFLLGAAKLD